MAPKRSGEKVEEESLIGGGWLAEEDEGAEGEEPPEKKQKILEISFDDLPYFRGETADEDLPHEDPEVAYHRMGSKRGRDKMSC